MLKMDFNLASTQALVQTSLLDLLISLFLAFFIGFFIVFVYRITHRGLTYERSFLVTMVVMSPIVALGMLLISSNLALSLGLVGALSIIRFRTVIKDTRDMVYLFWTIAVGLGCGTYSWQVISVSSISIGLMLLVLHYVHYGKPRHLDLVCVLGGSGQPPAEQSIELLRARTELLVLRNVDDRDDRWTMVFESRFSDTDVARQHELSRELREIEGVSSVTLAAPHLSLPI